MGYSCNIGDVDCEACDNWITIQLISDRYPFGYAVRQCKLDVERVCPDTASSHLCIPNEKVTCKTYRVPDEARAQRYRNYGINPKEVKLSYP